jgi:steroid delta-isomerase-like uncharacterized protein
MDNPERRSQPGRAVGSGWRWQVMTEQDVEALARKGIEAFNAGDWETTRGLFGPGFVYDETGTGRHVDDVEEVMALLRGWKAAFPDVAGEITRVVTEADSGALEIIWRGTHSGPLDTGAGTLPATGRSVEVWATMWGRWQDGRLVAERHHLDVLTMMMQLGAIPSPSQA